MKSCNQIIADAVEFSRNVTPSMQAAWAKRRDLLREVDSAFPMLEVWSRQSARKQMQIGAAGAGATMALVNRFRRVGDSSAETKGGNNFPY